MVHEMKYYTAWCQCLLVCVVSRSVQRQFASLMFLSSPCLLCASSNRLKICQSRRRKPQQPAIIGTQRSRLWSVSTSGIGFNRRTHKSYVHPAIKKASMLRFSTPRKECTPAYLTATIRKITNRRDMAIPSAPHER